MYATDNHILCFNNQLLLTQNSFNMKFESGPSNFVLSGFHCNDVRSRDVLCLKMAANVSIVSVDDEEMDSDKQYDLQRTIVSIMHI